MLLNTDKSNVQQLILGVNRHNKSTDLEHYHPAVLPMHFGPIVLGLVDLVDQHHHAVFRVTRVGMEYSTFASYHFYAA